jgi:hypothetical protein
MEGAMIEYLLVAGAIIESASGRRPSHFWKGTIVSEPQAAFLKLRINRENLVRWLDSVIPSANSWSDWRNIGGSWGSLGILKEASDGDLKKLIGECDANLGGHKNRAVLNGLLESKVPHLRYVSFDTGRSEFTAGSLLFWENLSELIMFFTLARGATNFLRSGDYGIAVAHNYIWGTGSELKTQAALRLGLGTKSEFMADRDKASAPGDHSLKRARRYDNADDGRNEVTLRIVSLKAIDQPRHLCGVPMIGDAVRHTVSPCLRRASG